MWRRLVLVLCLSFLVTAVGGTVAYIFEHNQPGSTILTPGDGYWWAIVSQTTTGYGDRIVTSLGGKLVAAGVMFSGITLLSLVTATIASFFVEHKIKEDLGLATIKSRGHTVICGWNPSASSILYILNKTSSGRRKTAVVLICDLSEDRLVDLRSEHPNLEIGFVKGDYSQEAVLKRANIQAAETAIILAQPESGQRFALGDERTIITAYAISDLAPHVRICAELADAANEQHLRRTNVQDVVVTGECGGYLLGNAVTSPGILQLLKELLSYERGSSFYGVPVPRQFLGRTVGELADYYKTQQNAILTAIVIKEEGLTIDSLLRGETSEIDEFIRQRFAEAERDYFPGEKGTSRVVANPPADMELKRNHDAIIIARTQPAEE